jgi:hypothetical protein
MSDALCDLAIEGESPLGCSTAMRVNSPRNFRAKPNSTRVRPAAASSGTFTSASQSTSTLTGTDCHFCRNDARERAARGMAVIV